MSLVVTLLTGARPRLLELTLVALRTHHGPLLADARIVVLHNGGDQETGDILYRHLGDTAQITVTPTLLGIGEATSLLMAEARTSGKEWLLHLEDDWQASPGDWYHQAVALLEDNVFQIRLRRADEHSLAKHMVTKKPIQWMPGDDYRYTRDAHYTLNPSLIRLSNVRKGWPAKGEADAQRQFWQAKKRKVAQLVPGIFSHIGGEDSLRKRVGTTT